MKNEKDMHTEKHLKKERDKLNMNTTYDFWNKICNIKSRNAFKIKRARKIQSMLNRLSLISNHADSKNFSLKKKKIKIF